MLSSSASCLHGGTGRQSTQACTGQPAGTHPCQPAGWYCLDAAYAGCYPLPNYLSSSQCRLLDGSLLVVLQAPRPSIAAYLCCAVLSC